MKNNLLFYFVLIILIIILISCSQTSVDPKDIPNAIDYVSDYSGVLSESENDSLILMLYNIEENTSIEFALVILDSIKPEYNISDYTIALGNKWGVGKNKIDNGIIFLNTIKDSVWNLSIGGGFKYYRRVGGTHTTLRSDVMENAIINYLNSWDGNYFNFYKEVISIVETEINVNHDILERKGIIK